MTTQYMTQAEYARHRGLSQPRISKMISTGKIPASAIRLMQSGQKRIDKEAADIALEDNLDRLRNPRPAIEQKPELKPPPELKPDHRELKLEKPYNLKKPSTKEMMRAIESVGADGMTLADAQRMQAQYKAALLALEYEEKSGLLVKKEQVKVNLFNAARRTRDAILNIPNRISAELSSITDMYVLSQKLTAELTAALEELSQ